MKQFNLKNMMLAAVALLAVESMDAAVEHKTITYDFTGRTNNATPIDQTDGNEISVNTISMWKLALSDDNFDNRFAVGPNTRKGTSGFHFKNYNTEQGLYSQYDNRNFAIRNLKTGDRVKINFTIAGEGGTFTFVGTPNLEGVSANAAVTSGHEYTVTSDGNLLMVTGKASADPKVYITSVAITGVDFDLIKNYRGDAIVGALPGVSYSDGYSISAGGVTMTLGTSGDWVRENYETKYDAVTFNQIAKTATYYPTKDSKRCNDSNKKVPDNGEYFTFEPSYSGTLRVYGQFIWQVYLSNSDCSSWQKVDVGNSATYTLVQFTVAAGVKYWFWNDNNNPRVYGFTFTPDFGVKIHEGSSYASFGNASEYNFAIPDALTAYAVEYTSGNYVTLRQVDYVNAGEGVLIAGDAGNYGLATTASTDDTNFAANQLLAAVKDVTLTSDGSHSYYVYGKKGSDVGFFKTSGYTAKAGTAYLDLPDVTPSRLSIKFEDDETTGVTDVSSRLEQGGGCFYDMQGRLVNHPRQGLYILQGKKILVK